MSICFIGGLQSSAEKMKREVGYTFRGLWRQLLILTTEEDRSNWLLPYGGFKQPSSGEFRAAAISHLAFVPRQAVIFLLSGVL